jgi:hypothetical protein
MNMHPSRRYRESLAALDQRVLVLEDRVMALAEALRILAHGLEDLPAAEPGNDGRPRLPGKPMTCCWWPGSGLASRTGAQVPDGPRGRYRP